MQSLPWPRGCRDGSNRNGCPGRFDGCCPCPAAQCNRKLTLLLFSFEFWRFVRRSRRQVTCNGTHAGGRARQLVHTNILFLGLLLIWAGDQHENGRIRKMGSHSALKRTCNNKSRLTSDAAAAPARCCLHCSSRGSNSQPGRASLPAALTCSRCLPAEKRSPNCVLQLQQHQPSLLLCAHPWSHCWLCFWNLRPDQPGCGRSDGVGALIERVCGAATQQQGPDRSGKGEAQRQHGRSSSASWWRPNNSLGATATDCSTARGRSAPGESDREAE